MFFRHRILLVALGLFAAHCAKAIGDSCTTATDCSINGDRQCDLSQTGGYCTIRDCDPGTCPSNSVCVAFSAQAPRLTRRFCMYACTEDSDCRSGYHCQAQSDRAMCGPDAPELLPQGVSCNFIVDPTPAGPSWCVQSGT